VFSNIYDALDREKQIKRWRREKKLKLIAKLNPEWKNLALDWL
jgi:putative endonuclease